jgi:alpha-tubulin suppressor-like RCC1 family protein
MTRIDRTRCLAVFALPPARRVHRLGYSPALALLLSLVLAALGCREGTDSPTAPGIEPKPDVATAHGLAFRQVSAGGLHTCGVTPNHRVYCWGDNRFGALGDGTTTPRLTPRAVVGGLRFSQVSAGSFSTCGVTTNNRAYCWGLNQAGGLGIGNTTGPETCSFGLPCSTRPIAVAGGLRLQSVSVGGDHACGLTPSKAAYCWGSNDAGQLGDGTTTLIRAEPVAVIGGFRFRQVDAAIAHTCGATMDHRAYCWGSNFFGQLGDGTTIDRVMPVAVARGLPFSRVAPGQRHTCGLTPDRRLYCWGENASGQLGIGTSSGPETCNLTPCSTRPVGVVGGLRFRQVTAGGFHTCGLIPGNLAYCWGFNTLGQLGNGTNTGPDLCDVNTCSTTPVRVAGGLRLRELDGGLIHTCGVTPKHRAYCWGGNILGQLGDGTTIDRPRPVPVAGATSTT